MRSGLLLSSALACSFALGWCAHVMTAQRRTPVTITRLYTGSDGETHVEEITDLRLTPDATRSGLEASENIKVTGLQFARTSPGWFRDWHTAERHQYIVTLTRPRRNRSGRRSQDSIGTRASGSGRRRDREGPHLAYSRNGRPHRIEHPGCRAVVPSGADR